MSGSGSGRRRKGKDPQSDWADDYTPEPPQPPQPQPRYTDFNLNLNFTSPMFSPEFDGSGRPLMNVGVPLSRNLEGEFATSRPGYEYNPHLVHDATLNPTAPSPHVAPGTSPGQLPWSSSQSSRSRMSGDDAFLPLVIGTQVSGGIEDLTLEREEATETAAEEEEEATQSRPGARGQQYTIPADLILMNAWLQISQDSLKGTDQSGVSFWNKIRQQCVNVDSHFFSEKSWSSCKARWGYISRSCNAFNGIYARQSGSRARSGENEQDYYKHAVEEYNRLQISKKKPRYWKYKEHWMLLRNHPKWTAYKADPLHESMCYRSRGSGSGSGEDGSGSKRGTPSVSGAVRPEGREAAKRAARGKGKMTKQSKKEADDERLRCANLRAKLNQVQVELANLQPQLTKSIKVGATKGELIYKAMQPLPNESENSTRQRGMLVDNLNQDYQATVRATNSLRIEVDELREQKKKLESELGEG